MKYEKEYACPECGSKLKFKFKPMYHNEYYDCYFYCPNCGFQTFKVDGKPLSRIEANIAKICGLKEFKDENKKDNVISNEKNSLIKNNMKIAFSGTHGTGKTTRVFDEAKRLKIKFPNKTVGILSENVINCPLPINKQTSVMSQLWIFSDQLKNEIEMSTKYDILVCDRSIFDAIAYMYRINKDVANHMLKLGEDFLDTYDTIYFIRSRNDEYLTDDGLRDGEDKKFRAEIDKILEEIYYKKLKCNNIIEL